MSEWRVPDRPPVGERITWSRMADIALVSSGEGRLYCRNCRSHFEEVELRKEFKSLRFCSLCAGWKGVAHLFQKRQEERFEGFEQMGMFREK